MKKARRWFEAARITNACHRGTGFDSCLHGHETFGNAIQCAKTQGYDLVASIELSPVGKRVRATTKTRAR